MQYIVNIWNFWTMLIYCEKGCDDDPVIPKIGVRIHIGSVTMQKYLTDKKSVCGIGVWFFLLRDPNPAPASTNRIEP